MTGDTVLAEIRDRGLECQVVIVSAVEVSTDILELVFDHYPEKPTNAEELNRVVERAHTRFAISRQIESFVKLATKLATVESAMDLEELQEDPTYARMQAEFAQIAEDLKSLPLADEEFSDLYKTKLEIMLEHSIGNSIDQLT
jgi:DNA-binding response OmpR family regulator